MSQVNLKLEETLKDKTIIIIVQDKSGHVVLATILNIAPYCPEIGSLLFI